MTPFFIQADWPAPPRVKAFSSLRGAGNLAFLPEEQPESVKANRKQLRKQLNLPAEPLWLKQVHGNTVVQAFPENCHQTADASFAQQPRQVCTIMTADCLPILLCNQEGTQIAAIHAGWRGLANGLIANTLKALTLKDQHFLAWLGPAIGPQKFEVGQDVYDLFCAQQTANHRAFLRTSPTTWLANIYELARIQLQALQVYQIFGGNYCTYTETDKFFSYRRDKGKTGRMASLIWIEDSAADV